jgi:hypothetical protein
MSSAAQATLYDLRPYWSMVCYPSNGRPYKVATIEAQRLEITSNSGFTRAYHIIGQQRAGRGFTVTAERSGRTLAATFGPQAGISASYIQIPVSIIVPAIWQCRQGFRFRGRALQMNGAHAGA